MTSESSAFRSRTALGARVGAEASGLGLLHMKVLFVSVLPNITPKPRRLDSTVYFISILLAHAHQEPYKVDVVAPFHRRGPEPPTGGTCPTTQPVGAEPDPQGGLLAPPGLFPPPPGILFFLKILFIYS